MPLDPSIYNLANQPAQFGPDLKQIITLQNLAQQMQARKMIMDQDQQGQNALRQVFSNPENINAQGLPTPNALAQIGRASPDAYMELLPKVGQAQHQQALAQFQQSKTAQNWMADRYKNASAALSTYDTVLGTQGEVAARKAAQQVWAEGLETTGNSGIYPPNLVQSVPKEFPQDVAGLRAKLEGYKASQVKPPSGTEIASKWEVLTDPHSGAQYRYNPITKESTSLTGDPYTPSGAEKLGSDRAKPDLYTGTITDDKGQKKDITVRPGAQGGWVSQQDGAPITGEISGLHKIGTKAETGGASASPEAISATAEQIAQYRMPPPGSYAMSRGNGPEIMRAVKEINPDYNAQKYQVAQRIRNDFASGARAATAMDATNTVVHHLGVLDDVGKVLQNHDPNIINRVVNYARTELGHPEATDFNVARGIIADEVVRAVVGSGAVFDRQGMQEQLSTARSPEQLQGQLNRIRQLMGGRLGALYQRWSSGNLPADEFVAKLEPETIEGVRSYVPSNLKKALGEGESAASAIPVSPVASPGGAPPSTPTPRGQAAIKSGSLDVTEEQYNKLDRGAAYTVPGDPTVRYKQ